jgi:hypothetical protein
MQAYRVKFSCAVVIGHFIGLVGMVSAERAPSVDEVRISSESPGMMIRRHAAPIERDGQLFSEQEYRSGSPAPREVVAARGVTPAAIVSRGTFVSVQINQDGKGNNIVGDAANEPTLAIDPTNPDRMVVAWRQFDTVSTTFREAGIAYSHDGGQTWPNPTTLDPGQFRSDRGRDVVGTSERIWWRQAMAGC